MLVCEGRDPTMRLAMLVLAAGVTLAAGGCGSGHQAYETGRAEFEQRAQAQLDSLDTQLAGMRGRLAALGEEARAEAEARIAPLERRRDEVKLELAELRRMGEATWRRARSTMEHSLAGLDSLRRRAGELDF
jgi:hypothetical protein